MGSRDEQAFKHELEEARDQLAKMGRKIVEADTKADGAGLQCDFELPYSSLPVIRSVKWS